MYSILSSRAEKTGYMETLGIDLFPHSFLRNVETVTSMGSTWRDKRSRGGILKRKIGSGEFADHDGRTQITKEEVSGSRQLNFLKAPNTQYTGK